MDERLVYTVGRPGRSVSLHRGSVNNAMWPSVSLQTGTASRHGTVRLLVKKELFES